MHMLLLLLLLLLSLLLSLLLKLVSMTLLCCHTLSPRDSATT